MRLDSTGNVLIGTDTIDVYNGTDTGVAFTQTGYIFAGKASAAPLWLNRITDDGAIANFSKNGVVKGSIGIHGGDMSVGTGDTALLFADGIDAVIPFNTAGTTRTDLIDLGNTAHRFKDLHLSGGIVTPTGNVTVSDKPIYANNDTGLSSANVYFSNGVAPVSGDGADGDIWYEY